MRSTRTSLRSPLAASTSRSRETWRSSATLISRRSPTSRSFRSRAASSSCCSSNSVTGARPPPPMGLRRRGQRLRDRSRWSGPGPGIWVGSPTGEEGAGRWCARNRCRSAGAGRDERSIDVPRGHVNGFADRTICGAMPRPDGLTIGPFTPAALDGAGRLLAARHRIQRLTEPGLSPAYEDDAVARAEVAAIAAIEGASGAVAHRGDELVGYVLGSPRPPTWGPNRWVEGAGHAVAEAETVRDLYGFAASRWVEEGATSHYVIVPATDPELVEAWFRVGFGQQHVHAIREVPDADETFEVPSGLALRPAERRDIQAMGRIDV